MTLEIIELKRRLKETTTTLEEKITLIISLEGIIQKKEDVERQLDEALVRE